MVVPNVCGLAGANASAACGALATIKVCVALAAAFQFASPACEATTATSPAPVNVRFVPPEMLPGPLPTANATASPLDAVAERPAASVAANALPLVGRKSAMAWSAFAAATVAVAAVAKYRSSCAFVATTTTSPVPAVIARFVPPAIVPGPADTA